MAAAERVVHREKTWSIDYLNVEPNHREINIEYLPQLNCATEAELLVIMEEQRKKFIQLVQTDLLNEALSGTFTL
ncbi:hypothetical protein [Bacillus sp. ISL-57]|uniref:hypothetical protein n=1 Tax=Bacillus sp. ISL-57 TaxID=2819135 RepID=UPI001BE780D4|nr:hypothetical protein [Bacillus sp. ISL-57]